MNTSYNELPVALRNSLSNDVEDLAGELLEVSLDSLIKNAVLRDIPIVSTFIDLYKVGHTLHELADYRKLTRFIYEFNQGINDEKERQFYRNALTDDLDRRSKEIEHILILINRQLYEEQSANLARLFISYLDGLIDWYEFLKYSQTLEDFLPGDLEELLKGDRLDLPNSSIPDSLLRLSSMGLFVFNNKGLDVIDSKGDGNLQLSLDAKVSFVTTNYGNKLIECLKR